MNNFEKNRKEKIFEIIMSVKLIYMLISLITLFNVLHLDLNSKNFDEDIINFLIGTASVLSIFAYQGWMLYSTKHLGINRSPLIKDYIEIFLVLVFVTVLIFISGDITSDNKFIYIFIVLIYTIQFGQKLGVKLALLCSANLMIMDSLNFNNASNVSYYFQNDLVLGGAFLLTGWILGVYVSTERQYNEEMQKLAHVDELTGLFNHRSFQVYLTDAIKESNNTNTETSLLFIDIDYFKVYNDTHGHPAGDDVLRKVSKIFKSSQRDGDVFARYGGEEFASILPNTSLPQAYEIAEEIRKLVETTPFYGEDKQPNKKLTISIGVSSYPSKAKDKQNLIATADSALYKAKFLSRNKVEIFVSILEEIKNNIKTNDVNMVKKCKDLVKELSIKSKFIYNHSERLSIYCEEFANYLKINDQDKKDLKLGAYLHDIGKIDIRDEILNKKEKLTKEEFEILKKHTTYGVDKLSEFKEIEYLTPYIKHHHERYDGTGYPSKLKGEDIPYLVRILSIIDAYDAITAQRPYNKKKSISEALDELKENSGTQFDPELVDHFVNMIKNKNK